MASQVFAASVSIVAGKLIEIAGAVEPPYEASEYRFDGVNNWLHVGAPLTGAVDGKQGTVVGWLEPDALTSADGMHIIRHIDLTVSLLWLSATGDLSVWAKNAAGTEILKLRLPVASFTIGAPNHFAFSWKMDEAAKRHGYANDIDELIADLFTNDTIDYTSSDWNLGQGPGDADYIGAVGDLAFWPEYIDLSVLANRRKFIGENQQAVDLGDDGSIPTGNPALILLKSDLTNRGTGGGFLLPAADPITGISLSANDVASDAENGTVIGTVTGAGGEGTLSYALTDSNGGMFAINSSSGQITVADNTGMPALAGTSVGIVVQVTDSHTSPQVETFPASIDVSVVGNIVNAAGGSAAHIQAAVDAAVDGDIVLVPDSGGETNDQWLFNGQVSTAKAIHIKGNGKTLCKIKRSAGSPGEMFRIDPAASGQSFKFSGITLEGRGPNGDSDKGVVLRGKHRAFEIFDCAINHFGRGGISIQGFAGPTPGNAHGVIYSNTFLENGLRNSQTGKHTFYAIEIYGDPDTADALALGTDEAVYVEDNTFTRNNLDCASNNNARYVFRHNTTTERLEPGGESVDAHGEGSWPMGSFSFEIYRNTINGGGQPAFMAIGIRGGQGVVFENTITGVTHAIGSHLESEYYPTAAAQDFQDHIHDFYIWDNTDDGSQVGLTLVLTQFQPELPQLVVEDTHYFHNAKPGYVDFTYPHPLRA